MIDRRLWSGLESALAADRFEQLVLQAIRRYERASVDDKQMAFPGFEHLPRKIRVKGRSIPTEQANVEQFLSFVAWFEKRAEGIIATAQDLRGLADIVRDQPGKMNLPEAYARATGEVFKMPNVERIPSKRRTH